jgi:hypothetical protein
MVHRVVTVIAPDATPFEVTIASEVFGSTVVKERGLYVHVMAGTEFRIQITDGWSMQLEHDLSAICDADTLIIPHGSRSTRRCSSKPPP